MQAKPTNQKPTHFYLYKQTLRHEVPFEGELHCCEKVKVPYLCNMYCEGEA